MAITVVGERAASSVTSTSTTYTVTLASGCSAGNTVILAFAGRAIGVVSGVTDSRGNTWTVDQTLNATINELVGICSTRQDVATLQSADTLTVTVSVASSCGAWLLEEISGLATASAVDQTASDFSATSVSSGDTGTTSATTQASEFAIGAFAVGGQSMSNLSPPTWGSYTFFTTKVASSGPAGTDRAVSAAYKILSSTGAQSDTFSWGGAASGYAGAVVTYKAATAPDTGAFLQFM